MSRVAVWTVLVSAFAVAGCSSSRDSTRTEDSTKPAPQSDELKSLKAQLEETQRQKKAAEDRATDLGRELDRQKRELDASRETAGKSESEARLSQDILVQQKKAYEKKIADLLARLGPGEKAPAGPAETTPVGPTAPGEAIASSPARWKPVNLDEAVAVIDGQPISRREFCEALYYNYAYLYLDRYIDYVLIHREAKRLGITVTDEDAERNAYEELAQVEREAGGPDQLATKLQQNGLSRDALLEVLRANGRNTAITKKLCVAERGTPEGKARFERKVHDAYERGFGERSVAQHLYIQVKDGTPEDAWKDVLKVAEELRAQLAAGEPWANVEKAARERLASQGFAVSSEKKDYSRASFGAYADAERDAIERALFAGIPGEVSSPVRWKGGVSIFKVEKRLPAKATFEEKKALITEDLTKPELSADEPEALVKELRAKAKIEKRMEISR